MSFKRKHKCSIVVPVFGEIPLHPTAVFEELRLKDGPLWAQFFKYGLCGVLSTMVLVAVVFLFEFYAPGYMSEDLPVAERQEHLRVALFSAFVPANLFAYFTNRWLVFTPGRYSFWREISIFTAISIVSFIGGEFGKVWMVNWGFANWVAAGAFAVSSAMVNFLARKFLVFSR